MFVTGSGSTFTIIAFIISILVILGGFLFSKLSKSSDKMRRNVSFGLYIWGGLTTFLNASYIWQIINGTFVEPESNALDMMTDILDDIFDDGSGVTTDYVPVISYHQTIEVFSTSVSIATLAIIISISIGLLTIVIGFLNKEKNWGKVIILGGIITMVIGLSQLLF